MNIIAERHRFSLRSRIGPIMVIPEETAVTDSLAGTPDFANSACFIFDGDLTK